MQPDEAKGLDFSVLLLHFICWKLIFKVMKTIGPKKKNPKTCEPSQVLPVGHPFPEPSLGEGISVTRDSTSNVKTWARQPGQGAPRPWVG